MERSFSPKQAAEIADWQQAAQAAVGHAEQASLRQWLSAQTPSGWPAWRAAHHQGIASGAFARGLLAKPGKHTGAHAGHSRLCLALWQTCSEALHMLQPLLDHALQEPVNGHTATLLCSLSDLYMDVLYNRPQPPLWPPQWGPSPFDHLG